jgi:hypothetical protein
VGNVVFRIKEETQNEGYEIRVLRRIFRHMRAEVTGRWRKLCNELLVGLIPQPTEQYVTCDYTH